MSESDGDFEEWSTGDIPEYNLQWPEGSLPPIMGFGELLGDYEDIRPLDMVELNHLTDCMEADRFEKENTLFGKQDAQRHVERYKHIYQRANYG